MDERPPSTRRDRILGLSGLLVCVATIEATVRLGIVNAMLVPPPSRVIWRTLEIVASGAFLSPLGATLFILFAAYFTACALAILVGLAMGRSAALYNLFEPLVEVIRPLPKTALLPLLILLLGLGIAMKLTVVALAAFFPVLINTIQGVRGVDPVLINAARTFGHNRVAVLWKVILPASLPLILVGMRVSLALGLILVTISEMIAGTGGLGFLIVDMQRSFRILDMYAWLVILAVMGFALNAGFVGVERRIVFWTKTDI
jgi:ABC-type nitrate/sulfonate/bicarbonate transport system permease component